MDDAYRQPRDSDRAPVRERITRAVAEGRISPADGDIRTSNVAAAQSMSELDLIVRDLDQLEAAIAPRAAAPPYAAAPPPYAAAVPPHAGASPARRVVPVLVLGVVVLAVVAGVLAYFVSPGGTGSSTGSSSPQVATLPDPVAPGSTDAAGQPVDAPTAPPGPEYSLTAAGIRRFIAGYRARFHTSRAVEATFYPDYVIVQVPVPGKKRHSGWDYRAGAFSDFGGVAADFPGSSPVDLAALDVDALMRNITRARRQLRVEDVSLTYVTISYRPQFDPAPRVNVYVSNEFRESGYLATTLEGAVSRAYPFAP